jgi:hypothetical protein
MKKLLYSTLALLVAGTTFTGCGKDDNGDGGETPKKGPSIEFQTNTGTFSGYTFADGGAEIGTSIKIGVKVNDAEENLKNTKMEVKFNNQAAQLVGTDSIFSSNTKTCNRDYNFVLPQDKGTYTFIASATNKNATTSTAQIVITAFGPIADRGDDTIWSLKSVNHFSAYNLLAGLRISASSGAGNQSQRDIVDGSTSTTFAKSWTSQNGTMFVKSGPDGKLNSKIYTQFKSAADVEAAFNATSGASGTITGMAAGDLVIAKSSNGGSVRYYLIGIDEVKDAAGAENDYTLFHYSE